MAKSQVRSMPRARATSKTRASSPPAAAPAEALKPRGKTAAPAKAKPQVAGPLAPPPEPPVSPAATYPAGLPERPPGKLGLLVDLLLRPEGASLNDLAAAVDWIPHSVGGTIAGTLKQKGFVITSQKPQGVRLYRIETPKPEPVGSPRGRGRPRKAG